MSTQNIAFPKAEMSDTSDKESADHAQFVHLFARDNQRIFAFIYSLLPSWADAQDVFQQTSLILWNEFDKFDQTRDFTAWANGIAFNTIRNFRRSRVRKQLVFSDDLMSTLADERVHCTMNSDSRREALDECLRKLPSSDRILV